MNAPRLELQLKVSGLAGKAAELARGLIRSPEVIAPGQAVCRDCTLNDGQDLAVDSGEALAHVDEHVKQREAIRFIDFPVRSSR